MSHNWTNRIAVLVTALGLALGTAVDAQEKGAITVASTTSTESSGLFEELLPKFEQSSGIDVRVVAVGTGQALEIGCRGDVDAVLVHAPKAEKKFVDKGCGVDREEVMYNDFIIVGPKDDPPDVAAADSATGAFQRIAESEAPFASRGDDSGTNKEELAIWQKAAIEPDGDWYRELGSGMGATLNTAAGMNAYTLTDRGTWLNFQNRQGLELLYEGDKILFNQYGSILVNPEKYDVKHDLATEWHDWLVSDAGQEAIGAYRLRGKQLFHPNAE